MRGFIRPDRLAKASCGYGNGPCLLPERAVTVPDLLSRRALGRATLARQLLLGRVRMPVPDALEHLVGLQAQAPDAPYVGLWSRLDGFGTGQLASAIAERDAVRIPLMRATMHLVTADDCAVLRPWVQPVLQRAFAGQNFARQLAGVNLDEVIDAATALLAEAPMTRAELGTVLARRWPGRDPTSLAYAVSYMLPLIQVPPRGIWGSRGQARWTAAESWIGRRLDQHHLPEQLFARYLGAFGPASVKDAQTWSGLTRLQEIADRLRPALRRFRDDAGQELLDLPDAQRPDPDTPAPPRFLPEYDNVLLSHAERSRIVTGNRRIPLPPGSGGSTGTLLVDGEFRGAWKITRSNGRAALRIETFSPLAAADAVAVTDEGARLVAFVAPQLDPHVTLS
jgi:Winged helix DNA-binding domain